MTKYISTRGPGVPQSLTNVLMQGMAPDGGLFVPDLWPSIDRNMLGYFAGLDYAEIAMQVMQLFTGGAPDNTTLRAILGATYEGKAFDHRTVAPLSQIGPNAWILELFHGPTLSFKDYALQLIGRLFDHMLGQLGQRVTILGATSGDTGSAAIAACRSCRNIDIFILHPQDRVSEVQRRQMTTVDSPNIFNLAIEGTFDDCQALVKASFADTDLRDELHLSAVNSINWVRILAQTIYYMAAAAAVGAPDRPVSFAVPTGNFGNVYAGWAARRMGLPIDKLIIASNRNDILTRFFETGTMKADKTVPSLSPSMDIQVSSNFERYLFELVGRDHARLRQLMESFHTTGEFSVTPEQLTRARQEFHAQRCSDEETLSIMKECYKETKRLIDPHTAVALHAARHAMERDPSVPMIVLSTAHPAKFPDAVKKATGIEPPAPAALAALMKKPEYLTSMPNDLKKMKLFMRQNVTKA